VLRRLTGQPLRSGEGERTPIFQLSDGDRHILAVFRLGTGSMPARIDAAGLRPNVQYRAMDLATGEQLEMDGSAMALNLGRKASITSCLLLIEPVTARIIDERLKTR